jgi:hypothetical protein
MPGRSAPVPDYVVFTAIALRGSGLLIFGRLRVITELVNSAHGDPERDDIYHTVD